MKYFHNVTVRALAVVAMVGSVGCSSSESPLGAARTELSDQEADQQALAALPNVFFKNACEPGEPGKMRCHAKLITDANGDVIYHAGPNGGLTPDDLRAAYKLPTSGGNGRLVAIVDGFDAPTAEADMNMYRAQFGIPACTSASGCFKKVNADGLAAPLPPGDSGWATEIAVDLDMVSAMCPDCKILLVEAKTGYAVDLGPAVQRAAMMGAFSINNSYGEPEDNAMMARLVENDYNQPGVLVVASSGDDGYGMSTEDDGTKVPQNANPANLPWVMSVGGTTLTPSGSARGWAETTWSGAGSGCSSHMPKPPWQKDTGCPRRMIADISAVGDPRTGVAYVNGGRWSVVGGTSISSPIVTGIFSLFGINQVSWPYDHPSSFFDVTSGNNGRCPVTTPYFCQAAAGYDGPTGLGTPNGTMFNATPPADAGPKPDSGGGAGGSTGAGGTGGTTTGGGSSGTAGSGPTGAGGSSGGSDPTTGGSGGLTSTTGSTTGTAGTTGSTTDGTSTTTTSGAGGSSVTSSGTGLAPKPTEQSGCSCRVGASSRAESPFAWLVLGLAIAVKRRRNPRRLT